jgi:hypothetical protein
MTRLAVCLGQRAESGVRETEILIDRRGVDIGHGHTGDQGNSSY